jgi:hypothetical protein
MSTEPPEPALRRLRRLCMAMPEATERLSHGEPTWFVRGRRVFVSFSDHHHDDRVALWCAAERSERDWLVGERPEEFFVPPYVGHRGWLGAYLDIGTIDWELIAELVTDAYRIIAPKRLVALLDAGGRRQDQAGT